MKTGSIDADRHIVVVGGGAAGMMAAIQAGRRGRRVTLLEPNRDLGRKLRITGKGRCNLTNQCDVPTFLRNVPGNSKFLRSVLYAFPPSAAMEFFEEAGVPLKVERGNRVFPVSDKAGDIAGALARQLDAAGVVRLRTAATRLHFQDGRVAGVETRDGLLPCMGAILATGGLSYPATGSTGDGYRFATEAGHTILPPAPSLVPLVSPDSFCGEMQGLSLRNVRLSAFDGRGKCIYSELGEMLFTHFGVSGPLVLSASAHMRDFGRERYSLSLDLKPGLDAQKLDARLLRDFSKYQNRDFHNALGDLAPKAMIPILVRLSGIAPDTKVNAVTREQRRRLVELFQTFPIAVSGPRPIAEAIVTRGGVAVGEVNPRTMESKLVPGLYFAGEILDVDAYTGGFNLQIAWATGYAAGNACGADAAQ